MQDQLLEELARLTKAHGVAAVAKAANLHRDVVYRVLRRERRLLPTTLQRLLETYPSLRAILSQNHNA